MTRRSHYTIRPRETLTARQQEVLALMAKGHTNGQIAEALGISLDGAKFHVSEILERLGVSSRAEAVEAWNAGDGASSRVRRIGIGIGLGKLALGVSGVVGMIVAGIALATFGTGESQPESSSAPTREDALAAIQRPGTAFHMEFSVVGPGRPDYRARAWYSADLDASRIESEVDGVWTDTTVVVPGREVSLNHEYNSLSDHPAFPVLSPALAPALGVAPHVAAFFRSDSTEYKGIETVDGRPLHRFESVRVLDSPDEAGDQAIGTIQRWTVHLRTGDLLPALMTFASESPDGSIIESTMRVEVAYLIGLDAIPASLFDADLLAAQHVTQAEALDVIASLPFATFWLGPSVAGEFTAQPGRTVNHHRLTATRGPGLKDPIAPDSEVVVLGYGPGGLTSLVEVRQAPAGELDLWGVDVGLAQEAGNVEDLPGGDGFLFVIYQPGNCTTVEAQTIPACRSYASGQWGALLTRDGTDILLIAHPFVVGSTMEDANPFSSREAMLELVGQLERLN